MSVAEFVAERLPERAKPTARSIVHLLAPWMSWRHLRTARATRARFVDRFFDSNAEFEDYEAEFFDGRIVDICRSAAERAPSDATIYDAHMDECVRLYALARKYRPQTVVETGVYHGVSTASLLLALAENGSGELHSLDASTLLAHGDDARRDGAKDRVPAERAGYYERRRPSCAEAESHRLPPDRDPGWILPADLREHWTLTVGRSQRELPDLLSAVGPVDLFVHDSEHAASAMLFELELTWEALSPGGMAVSFHVDHNDAFETFAAERNCERDRLTYTYNGFEDYDAPCVAGYLVERSDRLFGARDGAPADGAPHAAGERTESTDEHDDAGGSAHPTATREQSP